MTVYDLIAICNKQNNLLFTATTQFTVYIIVYKIHITEPSVHNLHTRNELLTCALYLQFSSVSLINIIFTLF